MKGTPIGMLTVNRRPGETVVIDGPCKVTVQRVRGQQVWLSITADRTVSIDREEVALDKARHGSDRDEHGDRNGNR